MNLPVGFDDSVDGSVGANATVLPDRFTKIHPSVQKSQSVFESLGETTGPVPDGAEDREGLYPSLE